MLRPTSEHCIRKIPRKFWLLVAKCENWRKSRTNVHFVHVYNLEKVSRETALFT